METKKIIGTMLVIVGLLGLIPGVLNVFEGGKEVIGLNPWALIILGAILFMAGISLVRAINTPVNNTINKIE